MQLLRTSGEDSTLRRTDSAPMALARILRLIRALADAPDGMTLSQLHAQLAVPKTSVHALLRGLVTEGYLLRSDATYRLGTESFVLGAALVAARSLGVVATRFLHEARAKSGESVLIAVIDRLAGRLTYTKIVESHKPVRYAVPVGTTRPLFATSAGRVLLAFQDQHWTREYLRTADLRALTPLTVTNRRQLAKIIGRIQATGHASTLGEVSPDVAGFAAPVIEADGSVNAAVIVAAPLERGRATAERLTAVAIDTARQLSYALGYRSVGPALSSHDDSTT